MNTNRIAQVASLIGEPARTAMLVARMDGRALTAGELAGAAHVTPQTASRHLALLVQRAQGRHRYHALASAQVARLLEQIMQLAASGAQPVTRPVHTGPRDAALRTARTCYDHLAGRLGVAIADRLLADGSIVIEDESGQLTDQGVASLRELGIAEAALAQSNRSLPRSFCRPCLDWSERRWHVAGRVGALICSHCLEHGWLRRRNQARALSITPGGQAALRDWLGLSLWQDVAGPGEMPRGAAHSAQA